MRAVEPDHAQIVARLFGGEFALVGFQHVARGRALAEAAIVIAQLAHLAAIFQDRGIDAVGAAQIDGGQGVAAMLGGVGVEDAQEDGGGALGDVVIEFTQHVEIGAGVEPVIGPFEVGLAGIGIVIADIRHSNTP